MVLLNVTLFGSGVVKAALLNTASTVPFSHSAFLSEPVVLFVAGSNTSTRFPSILWQRTSAEFARGNASSVNSPKPNTAAVTATFRASIVASI
jgi:hypothetical protein